MHHALKIQIHEILLNIFAHCQRRLGYWKFAADLAVLARTCRTFEEPALDVLWRELYGLSPLVQ